MRTILFEEREVVIRKAIGSIPEVKKITTELTVVNIVDTGIDVRAFLSIEGIPFARPLCNRSNYRPLSEWTEVEINNKLIDIL